MKERPLSILYGTIALTGTFLAASSIGTEARRISKNEFGSVPAEAKAAIPPGTVDVIVIGTGLSGALCAGAALRYLLQEKEEPKE